MAINSLSFRGTGAESAGSIAKAQKPVECPTCGQVSFKADSFEYSNGKVKKKNSGLKVVLGTLGAAALAVVGLGCAYKNGGNKNWLRWAKNENKFFGKVAKTCSEWCSTVKRWGEEGIGRVKNLFKGKGADGPAQP